METETLASLEGGGGGWEGVGVCVCVLGGRGEQSGSLMLRTLTCFDARHAAVIRFIS